MSHSKEQNGLMSKQRNTFLSHFILLWDRETVDDRWLQADSCEWARPYHAVRACPTLRLSKSIPLTDRESGDGVEPERRAYFRPL